MNKGKYNSEILANAKKLIFSNVTTTIIGLVSFPLVFKHLSASEYGVFTLVFSLGGILTILNQVVSGNTILPLIINSIEKKDMAREYSILRFYMNFGGFILLLSIILTFIVSLYIYNLSFSIIIVFISYLVFSQINTYLVNISLMYKDYNYITVVTILRNLLRLLIILLLIYFDFFDSALHYLCTYLTTELFIILLLSWKKLYFIYMRFENTINIKINSLISIKEIYKDNSFNFFGNNIVEMKQMFIIWIINTFFSTEIVGVFGAIKKIVNMVGSMYKSFESAIFPYISSIIERKENTNLIKGINTFSFIFTTLLISMLILLNDYIIIYLISKEYLIYSNVFIVGYFYIICSSFQLSQKSLLYSMHLTNIIFLGALIEIMIFGTLLGGSVIFGFNLTLIIISDIISKLFSILYKKIKLERILISRNQID
ncbi:lipopolysaccharide biosynthesis protein, partial [Bacillus sp. DJP31]|uniref:lipopolysaccharide biosynthesis protein n=1 Tax=Bacillus sp. DJP31 TaxID=3409789 RepID=UPI003BB6C66D